MSVIKFTRKEMDEIEGMLLYQLDAATRVGLAWRSEIDHHVEGKAKFSVPAAGNFAVAAGGFINTGLTADVTLPANARRKTGKTPCVTRWVPITG